MKNLLNNIEIAYEQENLIVDELGNHIYEEADLSEYFINDFAMNQIEFVSPIFQKTSDFFIFYNKTYQKVNKKHFLWPFSIPGEFDVDKVKISQNTNYQYKKYLLTKYDLDMQLMCGIHYNFSINKDYLKMNNIDSNEYYFNGVKNFYHYGLFLMAFTSNSKTKKALLSFRNSSLGYNNEKELNLVISNLDNYKKSIKEAVKKEIIINEMEEYSRIRVKTDKNNIKYLELRCIDLDSNSEYGIKEEQLYLLEMFMIFILSKKSTNTSLNLDNFDEICLNGLNGNFNINNKEISIETFIMNVFDEMEELFKENNYNKYLKYIKYFKNEFIESKNKDTKSLNNHSLGIEKLRKKYGKTNK